MSVLIEKAVMNRGNEEGAFWVGHSRFQIPHRVLNYKGNSEALVLVYLYERAEGFSFYCTNPDPVVIQIEVKEETIAEKTGLSRWSVSQAINSLEADFAIRVSRKRDPLTKQIVTSVYLLLHGQTGDPLCTSLGVWGVCHQNFDRPYIVAPKETREQLKVMTPSGSQTYLAALSLASKRMELSFGIKREDWKAESRLGRNAFDRGVKECVKKKLLSFKRYTLTLHDPKTGEASAREKHEFVRHENAKYKFDFRDVTAQQWQTVIQRLLKRQFNLNGSGWSFTTADSICPFCKEPRSFSVNFTKQRFVCQHCQRHGKLGQLVQWALRVTQMMKVKDYIRETIAQTADKYAEL